MQSRGKRTSEAKKKVPNIVPLLFVTIWWENLEAHKKITPASLSHNNQTKKCLMKNCAKVWSHGYGIYEKCDRKSCCDKKINVWIELYSKHSSVLLS